MDGIDAVIDSIQERESERRAVAERIRGELDGTLFTDGGAVEDRFVHTVEPAGLERTTVAGVDGGMVRRSLHGIDLIMTRAVAAAFTYHDGSLDTATYHPGRNPSPQIDHVDERIDRRGVDRLASLTRLDAEIDVARSAVEEADAVLLDGSLLPQFPDKPRGGSPLADRYEAVVDAYRDLYTAAMRSDTLLVGVVEDTRSSDACRILAANGFTDEFVADGRDTVLLTDLLEAGERTLLMEYGDADSHPILGDLPEYGDSVYSTYVKASARDRPVRLDVLAPNDPSGTADRAAGLVRSLAGTNATYGIPPVLIEADQRAGLSGHEVDMVTKRIRARIGHLPGAEELRRDRRPF